MNEETKKNLANFFYALSSNLVTVIVSALTVFVIPKLIGVEEYGYWQLFLFYAAYVPFLQFGWTDGIYLRYGGIEAQSLDRQLFFSQFIMLLISQSLIAMVIIGYAIFTLVDIDRVFIFQMVGIYLIIINTRYLFTYVLQATNRFKLFSQIIVLDRIAYVLFIVLVLCAGMRDYKLLIIADILGKLISLSYSIYLCREFALLKMTRFSFVFFEIIINIKAGINIMFANIASMLMLGVLRFGISQAWDIATFGKVSLTLVVSNFLMVFISAISVILFPILRRTNQEKLPEIYTVLRNCLSVLLLGMLAFYYPLKNMLSIWLPEYAESLIYMAVLFPVCLFESKVSMLINTYLKSLRQEKLMLRINWIAVIASILVTLITVWGLHNLELTIMSIVFVFAFRCVLAEYFLAQLLKIELRNDILLELIMVVLFIFSSWTLDSWLSFIVYFSGYCIYLLIKKKDAVDSLRVIKNYAEK